MQSVKERLAALLAEMDRAGVQAYIIPSSDPHMGEYISEHWEARRYFSGFSGSAGTLVVTRKESGLWTDGRYFIQAERELEGSGIRLFRMGVSGVPTYQEYVYQGLNEGETAAFDGRMMSAADGEALEKQMAMKKAGVRSLDLISPIWKDRPALPHTQAFLHEEQYAGLSCAKKLELVREKLRQKGADGQICSRLDGTAWLTNLRAGDIKYNPFAHSYVVVLPNSAELFIDSSRIPAEGFSYLKENGVTLRKYDEIEDFIRNIQSETTILMDKSSMNYQQFELLRQNPCVTLVEGSDLVGDLKSIKNPTEIENIRLAHVYDACAMVKSCVDWEDRLARGESVTECTIGSILKKDRAGQPGNKGESFGTIAAWNENAAMMHYAPKQESCAALGENGFLLVDSGGQYLQGTTDVTRTFVRGQISHEWKEHYTWVLKAHITLAKAVFLEGSTGGNLDTLCREQVWKHGINYRCGTGHGVGMLGNVHEGPQSIRPTNQVELKAGMTITDEPGIYEEGSHGIRTENLLLVVEAFENEYGKFLRFEPLTLFPIDTAAVLPELMEEEEIKWLDDYHRKVYETLSPRLAGRELDWLKEHTRPLAEKSDA